MKCKKVLSILLSIVFAYNIAFEPAAGFAAGLSVQGYDINKNFSVSGFYGTSGNLAVLIQDLHCHLDTQNKIAEFLENIASDASFNKIYVEGLSENKYDSFIKTLPEKIKNPLIERLSKESRISGAEYFFLKSQKNIPLYALEDEKLYADNGRRLEYIVSTQKETANILSEMEREIRTLRAKNLTRKNKKMFSVLLKYGNEKIKQDAYCKYICAHAERSGIDLSKYPGIQEFTGLPDAVNYKKADKELISYLNNAKNVLPYDVYGKLIKDVYGNALEVSKNYDIDMAKYAEFAKSVKMYEYFKNFDALKLYNEERNLTNELLIKNAGSDEVETIVLSLAFEKLKKFMSNKATDEDYKYLAEFGFDHLQELYSRSTGSGAFEELSQYIAVYGAYYEANNKRNNEFAGRIISGIENTGGDSITVVITGGFHTEELKQLLLNEGLGVVVLTPKINRGIKEAEKAYVKRFNEQMQTNASAALLNAYQLELFIQGKPNELVQTLEALNGLYKEKAFGGYSLEEIFREITAAYNENNAEKIIEVDTKNGKDFTAVLKTDGKTINITIGRNGKADVTATGIDRQSDPEGQALFQNAEISDQSYRQWLEKVSESFVDLRSWLEQNPVPVKLGLYARLSVYDQFVRRFAAALLPDPRYYELSARSFDNIPAMAEELLRALTPLAQYKRTNEYPDSNDFIAANISTYDGQQIVCANNHHALADPVIEAVLANEARGRKTLVVNSDLHHDLGYMKKRSFDLMKNGRDDVDQDEDERRSWEDSDDPFTKANWLVKVLEKTDCDLIVQVVPGAGQYRKFEKPYRNRTVTVIVASVDSLPDVLDMAKNMGYDALADSLDLDATAGVNTDREFHELEFDLSGLSVQARQLFNFFFNQERINKFGHIVDEIGLLTDSGNKLAEYSDGSLGWDGPPFAPEDLEKCRKEILSYLENRAVNYYRDYFAALKGSGLDSVFHGFAISPEFSPLPEFWDLNFEKALQALQQEYDMRILGYQVPVFNLPSLVSKEQAFSWLWRANAESPERFMPGFMDHLIQDIAQYLPSDLADELRVLQEEASMLDRAANGIADEDSDAVTHRGTDQPGSLMEFNIDDETGNDNDGKTDYSLMKLGRRDVIDEFAHKLAEMIERDHAGIWWNRAERAKWVIVTTRGRMFSTSSLLAESLGGITGIPVVYMNSEVTSSVDYSKIDTEEERLRVSAERLSLSNPEFLNGKNVILIDDSTVTGSTFVTSAMRLEEAGVEQIDNYVIAKVVTNGNNSYENDLNRYALTAGSNGLDVSPIVESLTDEARYTTKLLDITFSLPADDFSSVLDEIGLKGQIKLYSCFAIMASGVEQKNEVRNANFETLVAALSANIQKLGIEELSDQTGAAEMPSIQRLLLNIEEISKLSESNANEFAQFVARYDTTDIFLGTYDFASDFLNLMMRVIWENGSADGDLDPNYRSITSIGGPVKNILSRIFRGPAKDKNGQTDALGRTKGEKFYDNNLAPVFEMFKISSVAAGKQTEEWFLSRHTAYNDAAAVISAFQKQARTAQVSEEQAEDFLAANFPERYQALLEARRTVKEFAEGLTGIIDTARENAFYKGRIRFIAEIALAAATVKPHKTLNEERSVTVAYRGYTDPADELIKQAADAFDSDRTRLSDGDLLVLMRYAVREKQQAFANEIMEELRLRASDNGAYQRILLEAVRLNNELPPVTDGLKAIPSEYFEDVNVTGIHSMLAAA